MPLMTPQLPDGPNYGLLARFDGTKELYHACEKVRDAGFQNWDAHTPFPVHGLVEVHQHHDADLDGHACQGNKTDPDRY